jgi:hypothetical protein
MKALERANQIRLDRYALKCRVRRGEVAVADLITPGEEIPEEIWSMTLFDLLRAQERWGPTRARRAVLRPLGISETFQVGALTDRLRGLVVEALRGRVRDELHFAGKACRP